MFQIFNISDQVVYLFLQKLVLGYSHAWRNFFFFLQRPQKEIQKTVLPNSEDQAWEKILSLCVICSALDSKTVDYTLHPLVSCRLLRQAENWRTQFCNRGGVKIIVFSSVACILYPQHQSSQCVFLDNLGGTAVKDLF